MPTTLVWGATTPETRGISVRTRHHILVPARAEDVFAYLSDVRNEILWRESIVGSRYLDADAPALGVEGDALGFCVVQRPTQVIFVRHDGPPVEVVRERVSR